MSFIADLLFAQGYIATPAAAEAVLGEKLVTTTPEPTVNAPSREPRIVLSPEVCS